jgi:hypothetical protein
MSYTGAEGLLRAERHPHPPGDLVLRGGYSDTAFFQLQTGPHLEALDRDEEFRKAAAEKQRQQEHAEAKRLERHAIRTSYLQPTEHDVERQSALLKSIGISVIEVGTNNRIQRVTWPTFARDYRAFCKLIELFSEAASLSPTISLFETPEGVEARSIYTRMKQILEGGDGELGMPLFKSIQQDLIQVSPAHKKNPGNHTLEVFQKYNVGGFTTFLDIIIGLSNVVAHDFGKAAIADKDIFQDHAAISSYIQRELVRAYLIEKYSLTDEEALPVADRISRIIALHHGFELVERDILKLPELLSILIIPKEETLTATPPEDEETLPGYSETPTVSKKRSPQDIALAWQNGEKVTSESLLEFFDQMTILHHIGVLTIADRLSVGDKYSMFALSAIAVVRQITEQIEAAEYYMKQLNTVVSVHLNNVWGTVQAFLFNKKVTGGNEAVDPLVNTLATELYNIIGLLVPPDEASDWPTSPEVPQRLKNRLLDQRQ